MHPVTFSAAFLFIYFFTWSVQIQLLELFREHQVDLGILWSFFRSTGRLFQNSKFFVFIFALRPFFSCLKITLVHCNCKQNFTLNGFFCQFVPRKYDVINLSLVHYYLNDVLDFGSRLASDKLPPQNRDSTFRCTELEMGEIKEVSFNAGLSMTRQQSYTH